MTDVAPGTKEYLAISQAFYKKKVQLKIIKIENVLNQGLKEKFEANRLLYEQKYNRMCTILPAFHGTKHPNIPSILKQNLQPRKCKRARFGYGVYFSKGPQFASKFCCQSRQMLLCWVLIGEAEVVKEHSAPHQPSVIPGQQDLRYDTFVSSLKSKRVIVKWEENTFLPYYLIHFSRMDTSKHHLLDPTTEYPLRYNEITSAARTNFDNEITSAALTIFDNEITSAARTIFGACDSREPYEHVRVASEDVTHVTSENFNHMSNEDSTDFICEDMIDMTSENFTHVTNEGNFTHVTNEASTDLIFEDVVTDVMLDNSQNCEAVFNINLSILMFFTVVHTVYTVYSMDTVYKFLILVIFYVTYPWNFRVTYGYNSKRCYL